MVRDDRSRGHRRAVTAGVLAAAVTMGVALGLIPASVTGLTPASATNSLSDGDFSGSSVPATDWVRPAGGSANLACLTASSDQTAAPVPGCASTAVDPVGSGVLRLTPDGYEQVGTVYSRTSLPTAQGLEAHFDTYQWSGSGADGLSFVLAATDPADPQAPTAVGPEGGALGYSAVPSRSAAGVPYGYLGIGLDVYGSFSHSTESGAGCPTTTSSPHTIAVRGPGSGLTGYCLVASAVTGVGSLDAPTATTRPAPVPVEIAVNPPGAPSSTTAWGVVVPAGEFAVSVRPLTGGTTTMAGPLPSVAGLGFPASWYDPATGLPYQLAFGWAASSGGFTEVHEVGGFTARTLSGQQPVLGASVDTDRPGGLIAGQNAVVRVHPTLSATGGAQSRRLQVSATFTAGLAPATGSFLTATGYDCTSSRSTVQCAWTPDTPVPAGGALPVLELPISVPAGTATGSYQVSAVVSSINSVPTRTDATVLVTTMTAAVGSASVDFGGTQTLSVAGLPATATGRVVFSAASGTPLCTVPDVTTTSSCSTTRGDVGPVSVTARYEPAATSPYGTTSAVTGYTVRQVASSLALAPSTTTYGTDALLAATGVPPGATGQLRVTAEDGALLCAVPDVAITTSCAGGASLSAGPHLATATYAGDGNVLGSTTSAALTVSKAALSVTAKWIHVTLTGAQVTVVVAGLPADATGTLAVRSGVAVLCTATLPAMSCSAPQSALSTSVVDLDYSGDGNYLATSVQAPVQAPASAPAPVPGPSAGVPPATGSPVAVPSVTTPMMGTPSVTGSPVVAPPVTGSPTQPPAEGQAAPSAAYPDGALASTGFPVLAALGAAGVLLLVGLLLTQRRRSSQ
jgi:hypothetical protein